MHSSDLQQRFERLLYDVKIVQQENVELKAALENIRREIAKSEFK
jgi:hypothetical protein